MGEKYTTKFTYDNGIVTYVPLNANNSELMFVDSIWVANFIYALSQIQGADIEKINSWLDENASLTLEKAGIEIEYVDFNIEEDFENLDFSMSGTVCSKFKLDIRNGFKSFVNKDSVVENDKSNDEIYTNPQTGFPIGVFAIMFISLIVGFFVYLKVEKYGNI